MNSQYFGIADFLGLRHDVTIRLDDFQSEFPKQDPKQGGSLLTVGY